jgi:hypothetical protein
VSHPELVNAFGTIGVIPEEGVSEPTKRVMAGFVDSGERVYIFQFL